MRVHHLTIDEIRPFGITKADPMRLDNVEEVPLAQADAVVIPAPLREVKGPEHVGVHLDRNVLKRIVDGLGLDERRVVAFDCSDFEEDYGEWNPNCLFVRCNTKGWMKRRMPRTISWAWPVENYAECIAVPEGGFKYDVGGHMWVTSCNVRKYACDSVQATFGPRADVVQYQDFTGYIYDTPEGVRRRKEFRRHMKESRVALCPRSIHNVFPYRFFETMSAGRVPVFFCNDYVLPWADRIDYESFCVLRSDEDSVNAGPIIKDWLGAHTDEQIIQMGLRARAAWEQWLNRDNWSALWSIAIEDALRKDGLLRG